ncbi:MAG: phosphonoacetaldehyde reductase [bacterium]
MQTILNHVDSVKNIEKILNNLKCHKILFVCGKSSYEKLPLKADIDSQNIKHIYFSEFFPNPLYEDVSKGIDLFVNEKCDGILAIGGGSAIDVAKCIKLFCKMEKETNYLQQEFKDTGIPLIAIPTTAGTGSESTKYAAIYYKGKKYSVTHESILPNYAILDSRSLRTLSIYQKKCTMLDALCQAAESWWCVNSTEESKKYSKIAIEMIVANYERYLANDESVTGNLMLAANYAGRAINISPTTAAHAMSYKIISMYNIPHGHAVAVCFPHVWKYMIENSNKCIDNRGEKYLISVFNEIAVALGLRNGNDAIDWFLFLLEKLELSNPVSNDVNDINVLVSSVNIERLKNNPVELNEAELRELYKKIIRIT